MDYDPKSRRWLQEYQRCAFFTVNFKKEYSASCGGHLGRYIGVQIIGHSDLTVCEINVVTGAASKHCVIVGDDAFL